MNTNNIPQVCFDVLTYGACTKGEDCDVCNGNNQVNTLIQKLEDTNVGLKLNTEAKSYVPKSKRVDIPVNSLPLTSSQPKDATLNSKPGDTSQGAKLQFNLNANEYVPKFVCDKNQINLPSTASSVTTTTNPSMSYNQAQNYYCHNQVENDQNNEKNGEKYEGDEFDMIMKDIIESEALEELDEDTDSDADRWFPKYKDCECCKGFVYKCEGIACSNMAVCYCKMKAECDEEEEEPAI